MALNNPGTQIYLRDAKQKLNPQLLYAYGIVLGYSSLGTRGQRYTLRGSEQLADFGNGEGIELAAEILAKAGAPVDFVPIEGTGQTPDDPDKTPASGAVAKVVYGAIKLPGADANGDLLFQALANGATLTVQTGMSLTATTNGSAVVLTVPAATAANDVETWWNGVSPAAVAARAVFDIYVEGTGASNAGTSLERVQPMSADEIIAVLRAKHGEVEALEIPRDGQVPALVVLKAMPLLDFLELQHSEAKRRAGVKFRDPREITAPLLSCVVYGLEDAQAELADCPGFEQDLMNAVGRLAGALNEDIDVDFAEEPEPKKPIVLKVGQHKLTFRRLDSFDYSNARSAIGKYAKECPGLLSPLAMLALVKQQGVKEEAADLDRVLSLYPAAVESMGLLLYGTARGRAERRVGK